MEVIPVPVLDDNYAYLLVDNKTKTCAAIDPAQPKKVLSAAKERGLSVSMILTTHHHFDHAEGNEEFLQLLKNEGGEKIPVFGGDERVQAVNKIVKEGEEIWIGGENVKVSVRSSPCHTTGHLLFFAEQIEKREGEEKKREGDPVVFTGDTLFIGGCGRFFEGTPEQMDQALNVILSSLPDNTLVYCGHEYTVANLLFAIGVEPNNAQLQAKLKECQEKRRESKFTIPSTIGQEKSFNPFMRIDSEEIRKSLGLDQTNSRSEVMGALRLKKNSWKPSL
mmetsp:Transcript_32268/g.44299  ORF Transcript_32268/g.44299 Transcript_32268/m.44299 type:complete len:278 (-) Transcript_32268:82-915(-)|eukprot:CAMPEP_0201489852 /NCGR_PEP_ID=MMETSP0151_2-20130828/23957_1 /ASSEMBLY_ACC=CAM_ASM_000257 /TAXON_ID=200890 /ORGANISM="Paramoeba atlantica, Strain 621/1 / CCAP 1560/9" /LENGTH=277 /DNA_ID=CAMNT_0047875571 /DNA_START=38 /DNA_END=871 /DNA_ORIENTATION=+